MPRTLTQKIIGEHLVEANEKEYALKIDQTLTRTPREPWPTGVRGNRYREGQV